MNGKTDPRFQIDVGSYTDPVCKMAVERENAFHLSWNGVDYYFCAKGCRDEFAAEPERYPVASESPLGGRQCGNVARSQRDFYPPENGVGSREDDPGRVIAG